ncbi:hypothetical protein OUZ56_002652 [Daphnia magna]|uniref:Uncharacterized protein n=1 Tax=Daphnia magna TaxID=35525 RepID=A0ABR0A6D5_9CRUS|nr:hypothetical protein OUZ56_002652 [Daphnia magna]
MKSRAAAAAASLTTTTEKLELVKRPRGDPMYYLPLLIIFMDLQSKNRPPSFIIACRPSAGVETFDTVSPVLIARFPV